MLKIWKYKLQVATEQTISIPSGSKPLSVHLQYGVPCLWVLVNPENKTEELHILTLGTGHPADAATNMQFVGTYLLEDDSLVLHVFAGRGEAQ